MTSSVFDRKLTEYQSSFRSPLYRIQEEGGATDGDASQVRVFSQGHCPQRNSYFFGTLHCMWKKKNRAWTTPPPSKVPHTSPCLNVSPCPSFPDACGGEVKVDADERRKPNGSISQLQRHEVKRLINSNSILPVCGIKPQTLVVMDDMILTSIRIIWELRLLVDYF